jgi:N utilization substance protein B
VTSSGRHKSRHRAVQILYQCDVSNLQPEQALRSFYETLYSEENEQIPERDPFLEQLVYGAVEAKSEIDKLIEERAENWRIERMPAVDRNILRLAVYELRKAQVPSAVVIDEALELTRRFAGDDSVAFVNGLLDGIRKSLANTESGKDPV